MECISEIRGRLGLLKRKVLATPLRRRSVVVACLGGLAVMGTPTALRFGYAEVASAKDPLAEPEEVKRAEREPELKWGEPVNGLRAALEFVPEKKSYTMGETIRLRFHLCNVNGRKIQLTSARLRDQDRVLATDPSGRATHVVYIFMGGHPAVDHLSLEPNQQVILRESGLSGLAFVPNKSQARAVLRGAGAVVVAKPSRYTIRYRLPFPGLGIDGQENDWENVLETGAREMTITLKPPGENQDIATRSGLGIVAPVGAPTFQLKEGDDLIEIPWGEPVNGLRAALEFVPEKKSYQRHELIGVRLHVQNVSAKPIQFISTIYREGSQPLVKGPNGVVQCVKSFWYTGWSRVSRYDLSPGEMTSFLTDGLAFTTKRWRSVLVDRKIDQLIRGVRGRPGCIYEAKPGRYTIQYTLEIPNSDFTDEETETDWRGTLQTAPREVIVASKFWKLGSSDPKTKFDQCEVAMDAIRRDLRRANELGARDFFPYRLDVCNKDYRNLQSRLWDKDYDYVLPAAERLRARLEKLISDTEKAKSDPRRGTGEVGRPATKSGPSFATGRSATTPMRWLAG